MNYNTTIFRLQPKRARNILVAKSFNNIGFEDRAIRVEQCGTYLEIAELPDGTEKVIAANFCRDRLCPTCNYRRSVRIYATTSSILEHIDKIRNDVKYLFLTLTVKNVEGDKLSATLDLMAKAYKRLLDNRAWKTRVKGAVRTTEITINHEENTYHPHYHLILAVDKSYATKGDKTYWTHDDWKNAWKQAARLDYEPIVSIEAVKGREAGIREVSKYMAKDSDYLIDGDEEKTDEIISILSDQLHGRRLVSYTGIFRDAMRELKIKNPETGPLTDTLRGDVAAVIKRYHWSTGLGCYVPGMPEDGRK